MLDRKFIRDNVELVRKAVEEKDERADVKRFLEVDQRERELLTKVEQLRYRRNRISKQIGVLRQQGRDISRKISEMREVVGQIREFEDQLRTVRDELENLLLSFPNIPDGSVPAGIDKKDNVQIKSWGEIPEFDFRPLPHWELGERLDILDLKRATRIAGSGFALFKGAGAKLQRALINFMLDLHTNKHGYTEVLTPFLVESFSLVGTGQLPRMEGAMYVCRNDDLFLSPRGEVAITNIHRNEVLEPGLLPINYVAYTPCFRREAGSYGRDTRGLTRVHQFDQVELVKFVRPEDSANELEKLLADVEEVIQLLGIPYRVMALCAGDLSFAAAKCYSVEVWACGMKRYLEVSSCSNYTDFQARRMNIRFRRSEASRSEFVHTLNAPGVALPRVTIAIMENYQTSDGTILVPEVLRGYMDGLDMVQ